MNKQPTLADEIDMEAEESLAKAVERVARFLTELSGPNVTNEDKLNGGVTMSKLLSQCCERFSRLVERIRCEAEETSVRKHGYTAEDAERTALLSNRVASYGRQIAELIDDFGSVMDEAAYKATAAAMSEKNAACTI